MKQTVVEVLYTLSNMPHFRGKVVISDQHVFFKKFEGFTRETFLAKRLDLYGARVCAFSSSAIVRLIRYYLA